MVQVERVEAVMVGSKVEVVLEVVERAVYAEERMKVL